MGEKAESWYEQRARDFLLSVSSDDGWIDADSLWVRNKLVELLEQVAQTGKTFRCGDG